MLSLFLGWDQRYDREGGGAITGPYEPWQVTGLVVCIVVVAAFAGWRGRPVAAIVVVPVVLTLCFSVDAAPDSPLWAIGAALVGVGSLVGVTLVAASATMISHRRELPPSTR